MLPHTYEYCVGINDVVSEPIPVANVCMVVDRAACFPQVYSTSLHQWPNWGGKKAWITLQEWQLAQWQVTVYMYSWFGMVIEKVLIFLFRHRCHKFWGSCENGVTGSHFPVTRPYLSPLFTPDLPLNQSTSILAWTQQTGILVVSHKPMITFFQCLLLRWELPLLVLSCYIKPWFYSYYSSYWSEDDICTDIEVFAC